MDEKELDRRDEGLHLTDKVIHRISGPVSMYYLVPGTNTFMGKPLTSTPLIMLWGDQHRDDSGMCDSCSEEKGCYPIYDKRFLQELDKIAADYPVDFYTEYSKDFPTHHTNKDILFGRFLKQTTKGCHLKRLRSRLHYETQCPTKYIRWHYADTRFMHDTMEHYLFNIMLRIFNHSEMGDQLDKWIEEGLGALSAKLHVLRQAIQTLYSTSESPDRDIQHLEHGMIESVITPIQNGKPNIKYQKMFQKYVMYLLVGLKNPSNGVKRGRKSVILKQFSKILPNDLALFIPFLTNAFVSSLAPLLTDMEETISGLSPAVTAFIGQYFKKGQEFFHMEPELYRAIEKTHGDDSVKALWEGLMILSKYLFLLKAFLVDVYTLLRMIKPPEGSSPPYLAFGYFGVAHTHSMSRILQTPGLFDYTSRGSRNGINENGKNENEKRCIPITDAIHLVQDVQAHAASIQQNNTAKHTYQQYKDIIYEEETGREKNRIFGINYSVSGLAVGQNRHSKPNRQNRLTRQNRQNRQKKSIKANRNSRKNNRT
jgi:hypothetical protein